MTLRERLVLKRQPHLKWRVLDPLETVLMLLCGLLLFGFCTTVILDIITREIGRPWLAAGGHVDFLHLRDLHRHSGRDAAQRSSLSDRDSRHAGWPSAEHCGDRDAAHRARRRALFHLFRLSEFPAWLFQLPNALDDSD